MGTKHKSSEDKDRLGSDKTGATDVGAEEFSEEIYNDGVPTTLEFDKPHDVSSTGADLRNESEQQHK